MSNRLNRSVQALENQLLAHGVAVTYREAVHGTASSVNLDSDKFIGTVTHWPDSLFEFHFGPNGAEGTEVLETKEFDSDESLTAFLEKLLFERLL